MNEVSVPAYCDLEAISFLGNNTIAVSDILTAMNYRRNDEGLQYMLSSKFGTQFETHDLDFYLPQLWYECSLLENDIYTVRSLLTEDSKQCS
jgi:hypothetical protein